MAVRLPEGRNKSTHCFHTRLICPLSNDSLSCQDWGTFGQRDGRLVGQMWSYGRTICKRNGFRRSDEIFSVHPWNGRRADQIVTIGWEWALIRCLGRVDTERARFTLIARLCAWRGGGEGGAHTWSWVDPRNRESFLRGGNVSSGGKWECTKLDKKEILIGYQLVSQLTN